MTKNKFQPEYTSDYVPEPLSEPVRDEEGEVVEGCYRIQPTPDSDTL